MNIEDEDFLHTPRFQTAMERVKEASDREERVGLLRSLFEEIRKSSGSITDRIGDGVSVNNLDEVHAAFKNEINRAVKVFTGLMKEMKISSEDQAKVLQDVQKKSEDRFNKTFDTVVIKRPRDFVYVENLSDLFIPDNVKVSNLSDLKAYFDSLSSLLREKFKIEIPAPQVTVKPAEVRIPETVIPPVNLSPIEDAITTLGKSLKKLKDNNKSNPLAVRLSDGGEWLEKLVEVQKETSKAVAAFAGGSDRVMVRDANGNIIDFGGVGVPASTGDGTKAVTSAGTAEAFTATSTPCKYVIVNADLGNTNPVVVGGSTVVAASGSQRGVVLIPGNNPVRIEIDNVNKLYVDSQTNGDKVCYAYFN